jgi:hypothetical protein
MYVMQKKKRLIRTKSFITYFMGLALTYRALGSPITSTILTNNFSLEAVPLKHNNYCSCISYVIIVVRVLSSQMIIIDISYGDFLCGFRSCNFMGCLLS